MNTIWKLNQNQLSKNDDLAIQLLKIRGIENPEEFLRITKKKFHNPYKMRGVKAAVKRIKRAIERGEKIGIFGDYDADGVSATSLWVLTLRELGAVVIYFVPDRFKDGYGVNNRALKMFADNGVTLVITCDTGITAIKQVDYAKSLGMDIIITDHHEPQDISVYGEDLQAIGKKIGSLGQEFLIPNTVVVNPKRCDCNYPFKGLAGVGVSFKILCALCEEVHALGRVVAYQYMDIVSLGTFADMMDIVDENRVIGKLGLDMMSKTKNRGIYQLLRANDLNNGNVTSKDIGWTVAPCINAAGRIVSAVEAVEMLISTNKLDAYRCAKKLVEINQERKELTKAYVGDIISAIEKEQELSPTAIIVHYYPQIPEGIIGLVAARVSNHFYKPSIILSDAEHPGVYKGSGRSISAFDLFQSLMPHAEIMEGFGGHQAACGLSVTAENFPILRSRLEFFAESVLTNEDLQRKVYIDTVVDGSILDEQFIEDLSRLEPYGNGNRQPLFMMQKLKVIKEKPVGDSKDHFWALLSDGKRTFSSIGFFLYSKYAAIGKPKKIDVAFFPDLNEWPKGSGKFNIQLKLEDLREA